MSKKRYSTPAIANLEPEETVQPDIIVEAEPAEIEEPVVEAPVVEEVAPVVKGTVIDCHKLNVRRAPSVNATVLCKIARDTVVVIDESKSKNDWYSVCTEAGIEGFCMKKYIAISQ